MVFDVTIETPSGTLTDYLAYGDTIDAAARDFRQTQGYWLRYFGRFTLILVCMS